MRGELWIEGGFMSCLTSIFFLEWRFRKQQKTERRAVIMSKRETTTGTAMSIADFLVDGVEVCKAVGIATEVEEIKADVVGPVVVS